MISLFTRGDRSGDGPQGFIDMQSDHYSSSTFVFECPQSLHFVPQYSIIRGSTDTRWTILLLSHKVRCYPFQIHIRAYWYVLSLAAADVCAESVTIPYRISPVGIGGIVQMLPLYYVILLHRLLLKGKDVPSKIVSQPAECCCTSSISGHLRVSK